MIATVVAAMTAGSRTARFAVAILALSWGGMAAAQQAAPEPTPPTAPRLVPQATVPAGNALPPEADAPGLEIEELGLTVTGTAAAASDYLFRGISQTRNTWATQGTLDIQHDTGLYIGGFVSQAKFLGEPFNNTRQEMDALAGFRFTLADINFDIGWIGYFYPGQSKPEGTQLNEYYEVAFKANYTWDIAKFYASYNYSWNFFGHSGAGNYIEGGIDLTLPYEITAFGRVGYQWIQNNPRFGTPDYAWWGIGFSREIYAGFIASIGYYATDISRSQCGPLATRAPGGQHICAPRALFTISRSL